MSKNNCILKQKRPTYKCTLLNKQIKPWLFQPEEIESFAVTYTSTTTKRNYNYNIKKKTVDIVNIIYDQMQAFRSKDS